MPPALYNEYGPLFPADIELISSGCLIPPLGQIIQHSYAWTATSRLTVDGKGQAFQIANGIPLTGTCKGTRELIFSSEGEEGEEREEYIVNWKTHTVEFDHTNTGELTLTFRLKQANDQDSVDTQHPLSRYIYRSPTPRPTRFS